MHREDEWQMVSQQLNTHDSFPFVSDVAMLAGRLKWNFRLTALHLLSVSSTNHLVYHLFIGFTVKCC